MIYDVEFSLDAASELLRIAEVVGSAVLCPLHGLTVIVTGSANLRIAGLQAATLLDQTSCGAVITQVTATTALNGRLVARVGDKTDHGGIILTGVVAVTCG